MIETSPRFVGELSPRQAKYQVSSIMNLVAVRRGVGLPDGLSIMAVTLPEDNTLLAGAFILKSEIRNLRLAFLTFLRVTPLLLYVTLTGCGGLTGFTGIQGAVASLTGKITRSDSGAGLGGATVVFGGNKVTAASDGSYKFSTVVVVTRQATKVTASVSVSLNQFDAVVKDLTFSSGDNLSQDVALTPDPGTGTVTGKVVNGADGAPVADALVSIGSEDFDTRSARTASDGTFQVSGLLPGSRPMTIQKNGFLTFTSAAEVVDGSKGSIPDLGLIKLTSSGTTVNVTGTVKDENGNAIAGATVSVGDKSATTGPTGTFTVTNATVGQQTVKVSAAGFLSVQFTANITSPPVPINVVLFQSGVQPPGGPFNLTGKVTLANTTDASGVKVTATEKSTSTVQDQTTTGADGVFKLLVPPGDYTVAASKAGYQSQSLTVTVPPGGEIVTNVNFTLTAAAAKTVLHQGQGQDGRAIVLRGAKRHVR